MFKAPEVIVQVVVVIAGIRTLSLHEQEVAVSHVISGSMGSIIAVPASLIVCREIAVSALRERVSCPFHLLTFPCPYFGRGISPKTS